MEVIESEMNTIKRFACLMYHAASTEYELNKCRPQLFAQYDQQLENLPHTQDSLKQHVFRAAFVSARSLIPMQSHPSPDEWGWKKQGNNFMSWWMTQPSVSQACK